MGSKIYTFYVTYVSRCQIKVDFSVFKRIYYIMCWDDLLQHFVMMMTSDSKNDDDDEDTF
jgi:hypothetical protein